MPIHVMNKQRLAREWLIALGALTVGVTVWPLALLAFFGGEVSGFYKSLLGDQGDQYWTAAWLVAAAPYAVIQFGRSVIWAIKTVRKAD